jgi:hypothetical protein
MFANISQSRDGDDEGGVTIETVVSMFMCFCSSPPCVTGKNPMSYIYRGF